MQFLINYEKLSIRFLFLPLLHACNLSIFSLSIIVESFHFISYCFILFLFSSYIKKCWEHEDMDIDVSLIRHFVTEVLDMISPPYTNEFVNLFLPFIENQDITGSLRNEEIQAVEDFIKQCKY